MHPQGVFRAAAVAAVLLLALASAQQTERVLAGEVKFGGAVPPGARVGLHVVDLNGRTLEELVSAAIATDGRFRLTLPTAFPPAEAFQLLNRENFRLPGATGPLTVEPAAARFVPTQLKVYIDADLSASWTAADRTAISLVTRGPTKFAAYLFADRNVRLATAETGLEVALARGWNLVGVEIVDGGRRAQGAVIELVEDLVIEAIVF